MDCKDPSFETIRMTKECRKEARKEWAGAGHGNTEKRKPHPLQSALLMRQGEKVI